MKITWPWVVLLLLLAACLAHGLWIVRDLGPYTAVHDTYRDVGYVQGFLDGDLAGDPSMEGAKRYYPPLLHALAACLALITHTPPLELLVRAAPPSPGKMRPLFAACSRKPAPATGCISRSPWAPMPHPVSCSPYSGAIRTACTPSCRPCADEVILGARL